MENKQHVQLPNNMEVKAKDQLVYCVIKSFQNKDTKECFPSLQTIAEKAALSVPTIRDSIKRLQESEYITVTKKGRQNYYSFSAYKKFEPFSPEFIERKDITPTTRSYLLAIQQFMYKDQEGLGKVSFSNRELAKMSKVPESTIWDSNKELQNKNFLTIVKNSNRDLETGYKTETKVFNLKDLGQAIIWTLADHEERIKENAEDIKLLQAQVEQQKILIDKLLEERKIPKKEFIL